MRYAIVYTAHTSMRGKVKEVVDVPASDLDDLSDDYYALNREVAQLQVKANRRRCTGPETLWYRGAVNALVALATQ